MVEYRKNRGLEMRGFSLVELSIVLVILGLLTGGILAGQNLIRASELRSVSAEFDRYIAATHTFRDKYFAIPGDMRNATNFWGTAAVCPGAASNPSTTTATCDGDGDGRLQSETTSTEFFRFWQHLANAGLIEGSYTGVVENNSHIDSHAPGVNVPRGRISTSGWSVWWRGSYAGASDWFAAEYGNAMFFGGQIGPAGNVSEETWGSILTPEEAWNIDTKMDDGRPGRGSVLALNLDACTNSDGNDTPGSGDGVGTNLDADYLLAQTSQLCALAFINLF